MLGLLKRDLALACARGRRLRPVAGLLPDLRHARALRRGPPDAGAPDHRAGHPVARRAAGVPPARSTASSSSTGRRTLDLLATAPVPLEGVAAMKALVALDHHGLPLVLAAPVLGLLLNLPLPAYPWLVASLALGTPALSAIGTFGAALTVASSAAGCSCRSSCFPLYVPTLIFGALAVSPRRRGTGRHHTPGPAGRHHAGRARHPALRRRRRAQDQPALTRPFIFPKIRKPDAAPKRARRRWRATASICAPASH